MPELPEVETVARGLARRILGRTIAHVTLHRRDIVHGNGGPIERLVGRHIADVRRCGKQIRILLRDESKTARRRSCRGAQSPSELVMYVHLGMTGRLIVIDSAEPLERHTHLVIALVGQDAQLRFCDPRRFGGIWLVDETAVGNESTRSAAWQGRRLPPIGADPLKISLPALGAALARKRQIKALLMDQLPISGLGNIYCDEALHRAGIHPLTPAADLDPEAVRRLRLAIRHVLAEAIRAGGSSISDYRDANNARGTFQTRHRVYGRQGQACRTCGGIIERFVVAGRGTHVCPTCQPLKGRK
ncbi:MAG TPA: bifunctional DNA-formamidopyrimidine glycosylase/DNA-(apurinic or apyrimidinic site) lyase [Phycisphaerae bacterium]|nr:bifunctional DNA-formamidopyrimidine glycosylase/DNA-(apurinic or apyrimidinic site) lyase [Phycisphaerae bacterium]HOJ72954.1 bifunctional DNA-formamidopyrimidine glycosylase/DNA-(apurinic or apyrimidinic site) lyase [Phycisphaerae bacterium]HOM50138.1 bifunctional DNA-formamidopyrimidine glycosylase/DNA-(apurinic or apyrimidinic site) lyase [Phycisphaerae bacterium]HON66062.1 bifunctional DNA-formamidopyrimidine glycosylase/DNA-(apurinic or apyrimidinic site) lyase [Phycisphaerae bacterium]